MHLHDTYLEVSWYVKNNQEMSVIGNMFISRTSNYGISCAHEMKAKSCSALLLMLVVCIRIYLKTISKDINF